MVVYDQEAACCRQCCNLCFGLFFSRDSCVSILFGNRYLHSAGLQCLAREEYGFILVQLAGLIVLLETVAFVLAMFMEIAVVLLASIGIMLLFSLVFMSFLWGRGA